MLVAVTQKHDCNPDDEHDESCSVHGIAVEAFAAAAAAGVELDMKKQVVQLID